MDDMTRSEQEMLLMWFRYHMTMEQRRKLMDEMPKAYNKLVGKEVVRVTLVDHPHGDDQNVEPGGGNLLADFPGTGVPCEPPVPEECPHDPKQVVCGCPSKRYTCAQCGDTEVKWGNYGYGLKENLCYDCHDANRDNRDDSSREVRIVTCMYCEAELPLDTAYELQCSYTCQDCWDDYWSDRMHLPPEAQSESQVTCKFCNEEVALPIARRHDGISWVCNGCWDPRLATTE